VNASVQKFDFASVAKLALSQAHDLLPRWFPAGKFLGREFVIGDLSGTPGESLSINTATGQWSDFSTDDRGGDLISLFAAMHRLKQLDAAKQLSAILGGAPDSAPLSARVTALRVPESPEWDGIFPIPDDAPPPPTHHPHHGKPAHVAKYRDVLGNVIALVYRCEPPDSRKQIVPLTYCRRVDGRREWRWQSLPKPRSLYRVELLGQFPDARILLVEGEPKCDAVNALLPDSVIAMSWANGAKSWKHSNWAMLHGRDVTIWPDADATGLDAAQQIAAQLAHHGAKVTVLTPPSAVADGWDVGDAIKDGWDRERIMAFIDAAPKNAPPKPPTDVPTIRVVNGLLDQTSSEGEAALLQSGMPIFQRGNSLVRPIRSEVPASRGRTTVAAGLAPIGSAAMVDRLCQAAKWVKYDGRSKAWQRIDPPAPVAATILSRVGDWTFAPIAGVITTPTLRPDGSLLTEPGYDRTTRLYHVADAGLDLSKHIPVKPSRADAERALADLKHLIKNFPTVTPVDLSVALSAIISPVVRGAIGVMPMHALRASTAGTGKTYLVDVASAIATARPCPVATVAKSEEETEKRLAGLLLSAFPLICLDNVNGELGGDLLCQAIERPIVQIRPLGTSEIIEIESRASVYATGNALRVRGDMTRRTLICNLDAGVERPELRSFDFDPVETVLADRARYVGAVLTVVLTHAAAGFPGECAPLASFQDWSRYVRGALIWLGCADPCASMEEAREDDPELTELIEIIEAWRGEFGDIAQHTTAEIINMVGERGYTEEDGSQSYKYPKMREIVSRLSGSRAGFDSRRLGNAISAKAGRIASGWRIEKSPTMTNKVVRWRLSKCK
jgi:putative DNA primase/helicase